MCGGRRKGVSVSCVCSGKGASGTGGWERTECGSRVQSTGGWDGSRMEDGGHETGNKWSAISNERTISANVVCPQRKMQAGTATPQRKSLLYLDSVFSVSDQSEFPRGRQFSAPSVRHWPSTSGPSFTDFIFTVLPELGLGLECFVSIPTPRILELRLSFGLADTTDDEDQQSHQKLASLCTSMCCVRTEALQADRNSVRSQSPQRTTSADGRLQEQCNCRLLANLASHCSPALELGLS